MTNLARCVPAAPKADPCLVWAEAIKWHWDQSNGSKSEQEADTHYDKWCHAVEMLAQAKPTSLAGVLSGLRAALADFVAFNGDGDTDPGENLMVSVLRNSVEYLEQVA